MNKLLLCTILLSALIAGCSDKNPSETTKPPADNTQVVPPAHADTSATPPATPETTAS